MTRVQKDGLRHFVDYALFRFADDAEGFFLCPVAAIVVRVDEASSGLSEERLSNLIEGIFTNRSDKATVIDAAVAENMSVQPAAEARGFPEKGLSDFNHGLCRLAQRHSHYPQGRNLHGQPALLQIREKTKFSHIFTYCPD